MTRPPAPSEDQTEDLEAYLADVRQRFPTERYVDQTLTRKMRRRANGPYRPQPPEQLRARLHTFVADRVDGPVTISELHRLAGGSSKEQYRFFVHSEGTDGTDDLDLVVRLQPDESFVETNRLREFQVIQAVAGAIPVPRAMWVDEEGDELGQPALITTYVEGVTRPPRDGPYRPQQGFGPHYRQLLAPQFVEYFARLATHDWAQASMTAFDPPPAGSTAGVHLALNWWERVWEEDRTERYPLISLAAHWLRRNAAPIDVVSIVHGDLRGGNFLFDPDSGRITAVLDWETVHLGDRHEDLAYFLTDLFAETDSDGVRYAGGLIPRAQFLAEYERRTGLPVDEERLRYYAVFVNWRSAVYALAAAARCVRGQKTAQDVRVAWTANAASAVLDELHTALAKGGGW